MTTRRAFVAGALAVLSAPLAAQEKPPARIYRVAVLDVEVESKRMELLKALAPKIKRVGAVTNMGNPALAASWKLTEAAARNLKLEAELIDVRRPEQIPRAFEAALAHKVDGLIVRTGRVTPADRKTVVELAA